MAILTVNHAEQIIGPAWQSARPPIAKGHSRIRGKSSAGSAYRFVGDIPDNHGVGPKAELKVAHYDTESFDDAARLEILHGVDDRLFVRSQTFGDGREWTRRERQPILYRMDDGLR